MVCCIFTSFISKNFLISLVIYFVRWLSLLFNCVVFLKKFLKLLISNFLLLWLEKLLCMVSFYVYWELISGLICDLLWKIFHTYLRRMYMLFSLGSMFSTCLLNLVLYCFFQILCFLIYLLSGYLSNNEHGAWKFPTSILEVSISHLNSVHFSFMNFGDLLWAV